MFLNQEGYEDVSTKREEDDDDGDAAIGISIFII